MILYFRCGQFSFKGTVNGFHIGYPRNRIQLRNTVCVKRYSFWDPCGRYGRFYVVTDRSTRALAVTGGPKVGVLCMN